MGEQAITVTEYTCERCGHRWVPRPARREIGSSDRPRICPHCKSEQWHVPRESEQGEAISEPATTTQ